MLTVLALCPCRDPIEKFIQYFKACFRPHEGDGPYSLAIQGGRAGARLTHNHESPFLHVHASAHWCSVRLVFWGAIFEVAERERETRVCEESIELPKFKGHLHEASLNNTTELPCSVAMSAPRTKCLLLLPLMPISRESLCHFCPSQP
eukprot:1160624-Pelagomonas_calceolata.AAC.9